MAGSESRRTCFNDMNNKKYPRYFVSSNSISWGSVLYVVIKKGERFATWVKKDGFRGKSHEETLCEEFVKNGFWKEVTVEELALII